MKIIIYIYKIEIYEDVIKFNKKIKKCRFILIIYNRLNLIFPKTNQICFTIVILLSFIKLSQY